MYFKSNNFTANDLVWELGNCTNRTLSGKHFSLATTLCGYQTASLNITPISGTLDSAGDLSIPLYIFIWVSILFGAIFLAGVLGNIFIIAVIWQDKNMRKSTDLFILNLSVSDLLALLVCMSTAMVEFYTYEAWHLGNVMCKFVPFLENMTVHASVLSIVFISIERYVAICRPLSAKSRRSSKTTTKLLLVIWAVAGASSSPFLFIANQESTVYVLTGEPVNVCTTSINSRWKKDFVLTLTAIFFAIPVLLLLFIYARICRELLVEGRALSSPSAPKRTRKMRHMIQRRQTTYMLMAVVFTFFVCMLPFRVFTLWILFGSAESKRISIEGWINLTNAMRLLFYLNNALNPVLYNVFSTKFKEAFGKCCSTCRDSSRRKTSGLRHESGSSSVSLATGNHDRLSGTALSDISGMSWKKSRENWVCFYRSSPHRCAPSAGNTCVSCLFCEQRGLCPSPNLSGSGQTAARSLLRPESCRRQLVENEVSGFLKGEATTTTPYTCTCSIKQSRNCQHKETTPHNIFVNRSLHEIHTPGRCPKEIFPKSGDHEEMCISRSLHVPSNGVNHGRAALPKTKTSQL